MIIVTADRKVLLTQRAAKAAEEQGKWSVSAEEQLTRKDLADGPENVVRRWATRLLSEELSLPEKAVDSIRILSVFLETDNLNISLCGYAKLNVTSDDLDTHLRGSPRFQEGASDQEYSDLGFLEIGRDELLRQIFSPTRQWHFTSRYRLLYLFLKNFGEPTQDELRRYAPDQLRSVLRDISANNRT